MAPDVSIIIVNYNTFDLTCKCVDSIRQKTDGCTYEIIVVDNNSSEPQTSEFPRLYPDVRFIRNETNAGFAKANNIGIAVAKGQYILLLNSDTQLSGNAILAALEYFKGHNSTAVVTTRLLYPDGKVQHNCQRFPSLRYKLFELLRLQKLSRRIGGRVLLGFFFNYDEVIHPDWVWGTFFMFPRTLLEKLPSGKLNEDYFLYVEDMVWCKAFRALGYQITFLPGAEVIHFMGQSGGNRNHHMKKNLEDFMRKHYGLVHRLAIRAADKLLGVS